MIAPQIQGAEQMVVELSRAQVDRKKQSFAKECKGHLGRRDDACLKLGGSLYAGKQLLAAAHRSGEFSDWVEKDIGMSSTTAYDLVRVFTVWRDEPLASRFCFTALRNLAYGPKPAREEALRLAGSSEGRIKLKTVNEILLRYSNKKRPVTETVSCDEVTLVVHGRAGVAPQRVAEIVTALRKAIEQATVAEAIDSESAA